MGISVGGLVSGIDTDSLIAGLVAAYGTPKTVMESQLQDLESEQEAFAGLDNRLTSLRTALETVATADEFEVYTATSADDSFVGVSASTGAIPGRYSVEVNHLATSASQLSQGYASKSADGALGTGTFALTYGSTTTNITIDGTMSLSDLANAINEQADGVNAYVMNTGDAATPYRLVLTGEDTGAANGISVDTSALSGGTAPSFTEVSAAADAEVVINGITVTDSDNTIDAAIPGLSFTAEAVTTSAVNVDVELDSDAMAEKVKSVVDAYNAVMSYVSTKSVYNTDEDIRGPFVGQGLVSSITSSLSAMVTAQYGSGSLTALSQMGISTEKDGTLTFDTEAFTEAFGENPDDVLALFTDETTGFTGQFDAMLEQLTEGEYSPLEARAEALQDDIDSTTDRVAALEENLSKYEERMKKQFAKMEILMSEAQTAQSALSALFMDTSNSSSSS